METQVAKTVQFPDGMSDQLKQFASSENPSRMTDELKLGLREEISNLITSSRESITFHEEGSIEPEDLISYHESRIEYLQKLDSILAEE